MQDQSFCEITYRNTTVRSCCNAAFGKKENIIIHHNPLTLGLLINVSLDYFFKGLEDDYSKLANLQYMSSNPI